MKKIIEFWRRDKRYITMLKAVLLALLPVLCCVVYCGTAGGSIGEVYLPAGEWNDELFYYKQVEGIINFGYPQGYFGFNESHAQRLSFAAWSPVLVFPWIVWGLLFGWNLLSPILCNIGLMSLACFLFVWLVKPTWKQLGILTLLFSLYVPFSRQMLSGMSEVICFSMVIIFYSLAINYLRCEKTWKLVLLFVLAGVMTLMRPYLILFLLLPAYLWVRRARWKGVLGSAVIAGGVFAAYACIKRYLGAEYFAPLFFTDWIEAFFQRGLLGGIRFTLGKLYYMGLDLLNHLRRGLDTGLASGAYFGSYLVMLLVLAVKSFMDMRELGRMKKQEKSTEKERLRKEKTNGLVIQVHLLFSFVAMLVAVLLMYKLTEGSRHLLTFMAVGIFVVSLMETKFYKKGVLIGATFFYFFFYMATDPYIYQVPFAGEERQAQLENWKGIFEKEFLLEEESVPCFDNVVIWVFNDQTPEGDKTTAWQMLYALPEGYGISCCMPDYVIDNLEDLQSRYIAIPSGGTIDELCRRAEYREVGRDEELVIYQRY